MCGLCRFYSSTNYYSLLGVSNTATKAEIKSAFLKLSKKHHPDLHPASSAQQAHHKFKEITEAYSTLMDPAKRSAYDQQLYGTPHHPHFTGTASTVDEERFGFYKYNPRANAYTYARAYNYHNLNEAQWKELYRRSGAVRAQKADHFKVVRYLLLFMVTGTVLHVVRFHFVRKNHQLKSEETTRRNQEVYEAVRERGRNSSRRTQLDRLRQDHANSKFRTKRESAKSL